LSGYENSGLPFVSLFVDCFWWQSLFVTFEAQPSEYIPMLQSDSELHAFEFREIKTDFEFLVNSDSYLRLTCDRSN